MCGEFNLYKLDYAISEKQNNRCIVQIVYKTNTSETNVEQILSVIIHKNFANVLLVKLRCFEHTEQPDGRGKEGSEQSESDIEGTKSDED